MSNRLRPYWICQGSGWLAYAVFGIIIGFAFQTPSLEYALTALLNSATGLGLSHAWRSLMRRRGWMRLSLRALAPRVLGSGVLIAMLWTVLSGLMSKAFFGQWPSGAVTLAVWFNWNMALLVWALLYCGWHLFKRYQQAEIQKWRLEAVLKETELNALKAQLNPHFLFNALNSIRALIVEDPARGQDAVTQLANILRYSLQASSAASIPLREEVRFVQAYLALEKIRFDDRLTVLVQCEEASLACAVPPMVVQTLIENAIKHGIAARHQGGRIVLCAWIEHAKLRIQVRNDGVLSPEASATRVGLRNARERLQLLFGAQATLTVTENDEDGVTADLTLPLQYGGIRSLITDESLAY